ncbi:EF-hand domain-containing protein [Nonomuraea wenchangensis]|uniref:EF-hand domain-containing protein n=1 Tax=Nonomuraea wenchangensis TaxID=568860 RepID=UPI00371D87C2
MPTDPTDRLIRLRTRFALLDTNGNGHLQGDDFALLADRVLDSLSADRDSAKAHALTQGCRTFWQGLAAACDRDGDATVTFQEYAAAIPDAAHFDQYGSPYARALVALADTDDDGQVEQGEFIACMTAIGFAPPHVRQLFAALAGQRGRITTDAWSAAIRDYYVSDSANTPGQLLANQPA